MIENPSAPMGRRASPATYFTSSLLSGMLVVSLSCSPSGVRLCAPRSTSGCMPVPRSATPPLEVNLPWVAAITSSVAPSARRGRSSDGVIFTPGTMRIRLSWRSSVAWVSGFSASSGPARVSSRRLALPMSPSMRTLPIWPSTTVTTTRPLAKSWFWTSANDSG
ncbi:Uncharacterised protein [Bordetella pertussis]|nr:Uncharacterised protein [Bordetella pertussis]